MWVEPPRLHERVDAVTGLHRPIHTNGEAPTFESWRTTTIEDGKRFTATVDAVQPSSERVDSDGQVIDQTEGGRFELHFAIAFDTEWSILAVDATSLVDSAG